ncbi:LysR family transcriptional regulator [Acidovorax sp. Be4]|uniref:LysR family transcriptional regulator n=1 Tax=Acidovorax bellezanensis TaxID=2976702 RepID=A0ABT2PNB3_9BURK|nr:LysR family transcriptional regulator [Acidovorax sp. Be4]MCT9811971.1 LysR family transcriptional regulator [Acidovorax sp. Be4]
MSSPRDALTPDSLAMLQVIADTGSFAAAARSLGLVPSALTYRVRQMEDALDVLLFDRRSRQAQPTEAGMELLREGARLLQDIDSLAHRVRRVATGWEPQLTIVTDGVLARGPLFDLVEAFYAIAPPTRLKLREGILNGTLEPLTNGRADLAIGVAVNASNVAGIQLQDLGDLAFILAVAPHHPLAQEVEPISDATLLQHRAIAVADSGLRDTTSVGLLDGQQVLTVDSMAAKIEAQVRGLGYGFLPQGMVRAYEQAGKLVVRQVVRPARSLRVHYAWTTSGHASPGRALQWWLEKLSSPTTRAALLENHQDC